VSAWIVAPNRDANRQRSCPTEARMHSRRHHGVTEAPAAGVRRRCAVTSVWLP
jgi:hypothetical protein